MPYHIGPGKFAGVIMTFVDITEIKIAHNHLEQSHQTSEDISTYMPAGLFVYARGESGELVLERSNPEAERMTGIGIEKWGGRRFDEIWPNAASLGLTERFLKVLETGEPCFMEDTNYQDNRSAGDYRIHAFRLPGGRLGVSFESISEKKQMQADLMESEARYRNLFETMAQGVVYQGADGRIISANPSAERILGLSLAQMMGRTSMDPRWRTVQEDGSPLAGDAHPSMVALRTGKPVIGYLMGVHHLHAERPRWIMVNAIPEFRQGQDAPYQVYTTFEDITDRVGFGKKLLKAQERLDYISQAAALAWWDWDILSGKIAVSARKAEMIGFAPDEVGGDIEFWNSRIHPEDRDRVLKALRDHLDGKTDQYSVQCRLMRKDGEYIALSDRGEIVERKEDGRPARFLGVVRPWVEPRGPVV